MSNSKISALPSATTPLAGTEVLPIVQSSTTDQVTVANLTAGRAVSASSFIAPTIGAASGSALSIQSNGTTNATLNTSGLFLVGLPTSIASNGVAQISGQSDTRLIIDSTSTQGVYFTKSGSDNGTFRVDSSGNYNWFVKGAGTANMTLFSNGGLSIGNTTDPGSGNLQFNSTSNGIYFGSSSLLSDYEVGTWTPVLEFGGANTGWSFYGNGGIYGKYTKIGNLVTVTGMIGILSTGSSTGAATITGLPYTTLSSGVTVGSGMNIIGLATGSGPSFYVSSNSTTMNLQGGAGTNLTNSNFAAYSELHFSFSYQV